MALALAGPAAAQLALTGELAVNTLTTGNQFVPAVALRPDGGFVVTWESDGADGDEFGVRARRFTNAGAGVGNEGGVNDVTMFTQRLPAIGVDGSGNFRIAWQTEVVAERLRRRRPAVRRGQHTAGRSVRGQRLHGRLSAQRRLTSPSRPTAASSSGGTTVSRPTRTSFADLRRRWRSDCRGDRGESVGKRYLSHPAAVAMDALGNLVVAWEAELVGELHNIYARLFDADGAPLTGEFRVSATVAGAQKAPDVARQGTGEFLVVWESFGQDGDQTGVYGQRFTALGAASGPEFRVNLATTRG